MPTRLLREGILDSEAVNRLGWAAEVFYRRLMSAVDDFGRLDARPAVLRSRLYPLHLDTVTDANIREWLAECVRAGLLITYAVEGKPYLEFLKLGEPRAKSSKYPPPPPANVSKQTPAEIVESQRLQTDVNECSQASADVPYSSSDSYSDSPSDYSSSKSTRDKPGPVPAEEPESTRGRKTPDTPHHRAIAAFCDAWKAKYGRPYPVNSGKDGSAFAWMLKQVDGDDAKLSPIFARYLADDDPFYAAANHDIATLRNKFTRWAVEAPPRGGSHDRIGNSVRGKAIDNPSRVDSVPGDYAAPNPRRIRVGVPGVVEAPRPGVASQQAAEG